MALHDQVNPLPRWVIYLIGCAMFGVVVYLDLLTAPGLSMALFYLGPIYFLTWHEGVGPGVAMVCLSTVARIAADTHWGQALAVSPLMGWDRLARFFFLLVSTVLLGRLRESFLHAREGSRIDFLTGLCNRREFFALAEQERLRAARYGKCISVAYIDLDSFKEVNDKLGHSAGDAVLVDIATELRRNLRATDVVARMGGDEFVILLPETDASAARTAIEKLRGLLLDLSQQRNWPITYSIGLVTFEQAPRSTDDMIGEADRLMYSIKRGTKNSLALGVWPQPANNSND